MKPLLLTALLMTSLATHAQPSFTGPREDDRALPEHFLQFISDKNHNVGLPHLDSTTVLPNTVELRVYTDFKAHGQGGHAAVLQRLVWQNGELHEAINYPACATRGVSSKADLVPLAEALGDAQLFDIPDERALLLRRGLYSRPEVVYVVQVASEHSERSFFVTDPQKHTRMPALQRFVQAQKAIDLRLGSPVENCFALSQN